MLSPQQKVKVLQQCGDTDDAVEEYLDAVAIEDTASYACCVNLTKIRYTLARKYDLPTADEYVDWLSDPGIEPVDVGDTWVAVSEYILTHNPALGDAFALAAAETVETTLLVGGDEFSDILWFPVCDPISKRLVLLGEAIQL